ncbi:MAG: hypothetical protein JW712_07380 [Dehalococcoidales bacterium]|nr:hypothetical protein [Dehalococcoidales bacterium]
MQEYIKNHLGIVLGLLSITTLGILVYFLITGLVSDEPHVSWVLVAILGVSLLFVLMMLMSVYITVIGIGNINEAFGLPSGSIRAILALCLVVIFVICVVFVYGDMANIPPRTIQNVTTEQYHKLSLDQIISSEVITDTKTGETLYTVELTGIPRSAAAQDVAKQVVTLVGTLMTAVTAFYFATKVAENKASGAGQAVESKPVLNIASPASPAVWDTKKSEMQVKLDVSPKDSAVEWDQPVGDPEGQLVQTKPGEFVYRRGKNRANRIALLFRIANGKDTEKTLVVDHPNLTVSSPGENAEIARTDKDGLTIKLEVIPENAEVSGKISKGDDKGILEQISPMVFSYKPGEKADAEVILHFELSKYKNDKENCTGDLKVTVT